MTQNPTRTAGMHRTTGKLLTEEAHIAQCIGDILSTPVGTRVMREGYGSLIPDLIDQPQGPALDLKLIAASFMAIIQWETRIRPTTMTLSAVGIDGKRELVMEAVRTDGPLAGQTFNLASPIYGGAA